jgi:hypothetical protein
VVSPSQMYMLEFAANDLYPAVLYSEVSQAKLIIHKNTLPVHITHVTWGGLVGLWPDDSEAIF